MSIIVRDVVMPDCCKNCACSAGYGCEITSTIMTTKEMESRPDWCPLEEVEPCEDAVSRQAAIDVAHKIIYGFLDLVDDDSEEPTSDRDKLLLEVNKSICNGIKDLVSAQPEREGRKDDEQIRGFGL